MSMSGKRGAGMVVEPIVEDIVVDEIIEEPFFHHFDDCYTVSYLALVEEILNYSTAGDHGSTYWFPVYDPHTLQPVGTFQESTIDTHDGECISTGSFSFEYTDSTQSYDSSIIVASSCTGTFSSVIGGSGKFNCATGYQEFSEHTEQNKFIRTNLYLCDTPCHVPLKEDFYYTDDR